MLAVKQFETDNPEANLKLMDKIETGDLSIDRATKLIDSYESQQVELDEIKPIAPVVLEPNVDRLWTLYNSSSLNMEELMDGMIQTVITSGPYWRQRKYGIGEQKIPELGLEAT